MLFLGDTFFGLEDSIAYTPMDECINIDSIILENALIDKIYGTQNSKLSFESPLDVWDLDTRFWGEFDGNANLGNVYFDRNCTDIVIRRKAENEDNWVTVAHRGVMVDDDFNIAGRDYTAKGGVKYDYAYVPVYVDGSDADYVFSKIYSEFEGVYLVDDENVFGTVLNLSNINTNRNKQFAMVERPYNRYPIYTSNSISNYDTGNVSGYFIEGNGCNCNANFDNNVKYRIGLMDFLTNGKSKLLKAPDGREWLIDVTSNPSEEGESLGLDIKTTSFDWTEIGNCNSDKDINESGVLNIPERLWVS